MRPYNILYRATDDIVEVIHILHGARDLQMILKDDDI